MRRTRFMTWCFLALSLALFCVRDFRPALEAPLASLLPVGWTGEFGAAAAVRSDDWAREQTKLQVRLLDLGTGPILERLFSLRRYVTPVELRQMARDAERAGDTEFMGFAALHLPEQSMCDDILRLTDRAVTTNPKLTWLVYYTAAGCAPESRSGPLAKDWQAQVDKLEAWDPDNGAPHFLRANMIRFGEGWKWESAASNVSKIRDVLPQHLEWQKEMEAAFARPRFKSYRLQRFELERRAMIARGWNHPLVLAYTLGNGGPNIFALQHYAVLLVSNMGADAEAEGRIEDALTHYRIAARFGERMSLQSHTSIEELLGMLIQRAADERLVPALKKAGKADEGAAVEYAQKQLLNEIDRRWRDPMARTSNRSWSVLLTSVAGTAVWVFLFLSLASVSYVNAKLLIRRDKKGRLYQVMTVLENYAPIMLFSSCLALGLIYAPFAQNFSFYLAVKEPLISWGPLYENSFPTPQTLGPMDLPIQNPYRGFVAYTLVIVGLMVAVAIIRSRLEARKKSR